MNLTETILPMPDDYEGKVIATLLRADSTAPSGRAVLYLHGYIDYFFQTHMAERFAGEGWNFYALDLRKYGRSSCPINMPIIVGTCTNIFRKSMPH
ncbi:MAG: alpha/beta hydrolase [Alistipes indistinctus]